MAPRTATYPVYPDASYVPRTVRIGGVSPEQILEELARRCVLLNEAARVLLASPCFVWSPDRRDVLTVELAVRDLGLPEGGVMGEILARAAEVGLHPCPMELAPHMRLQYMDQPEGSRGFPATAHQAPPGSITIVSDPLAADDAFPKGFYLRRIDGVLWLRGYAASKDHRWNAADRMVFIEAEGMATFGSEASHS